MNDLREKTIRGGLAKACSQAATFVLRLGSVMVLGRLLGPKEFGLVGMVTALIGVLNLLKDFGLSTATVQRAEYPRISSQLCSGSTCSLVRCLGCLHLP